MKDKFEELVQECVESILSESTPEAYPDKQWLLQVCTESMYKAVKLGEARREEELERIYAAAMAGGSLEEEEQAIVHQLNQIEDDENYRLTWGDRFNDI